jgi:nucleoside 2-deoxyribosyltransferase
MKTFLICPVRGHDIKETEEIVAKLERTGWEVYWPPRDTDQMDITGYRICQDNRRAIEQADAIHFIWDGKSQGCLFDLGMAFVLGKKVIPVAMPELTDGKSFQNMVNQWAGITE